MQCPRDETEAQMQILKILGPEAMHQCYLIIHAIQTVTSKFKNTNSLSVIRMLHQAFELMKMLNTNSPKVFTMSSHPRRFIYAKCNFEYFILKALLIMVRKY